MGMFVKKSTRLNAIAAGVIPASIDRGSPSKKILARRFHGFD